jgi:hypothetical protein
VRRLGRRLGRRAGRGYRPLMYLLNKMGIPFRCGWGEM